MKDRKIGCSLNLVLKSSLKRDFETQKLQHVGIDSSNKQINQ